MQKCASLNSLTTTKTWLESCQRLPVPVVQRRAAAEATPAAETAAPVAEAPAAEEAKLNNSTILLCIESRS